VAIGCLVGRPIVDQVAGAAPKALLLQAIAVVNDGVCDLGRMIVLRLPPKPDEVATGIQNALQLAIDLRAAGIVIKPGPTRVGGFLRGSNPWLR
jgi:hypothetical protein